MQSENGEVIDSIPPSKFSYNHYLVGFFLICMFLLSGCIDVSNVYYGIDVELLSDDEIADITSPFMNITHLDFSVYPTLYQIITFLIDPSTDQSSQHLEIPKDEWNRIQSIIGGSYFTYYHFYFSIGYMIS
ncbi:MAG: hypothetical protein ACXADY_16810 [Candidatus Hodarchaeales archaeon]|jgi:hypothetical protein